MADPLFAVARWALCTLDALRHALRDLGGEIWATEGDKVPTIWPAQCRCQASHESRRIRPQCPRDLAQKV